MDETMQAANAGAPEGIATPTTSEPVQNASEGFVQTSTDPQDTSSPTQPTTAGTPPTAGTPTAPPVVSDQADVTQTQKFAHRLREEKQAARDSIIAELYGANGIRTEAEYKQAVERQRLEAEGKDPDTYMKINTLESELSKYKRTEAMQKQESELLSDPIRKKLYSDWQQDIKEIATNLDTDLTTAFLMVLGNKLPDLLSGEATKAEQLAVQKLINNTQTTPGSLAAPAAERPKSYEELSDAEFDAVYQKARRGELKKS